MIQVVHVVGLMNMGGTETMLMNLYRKIDRMKYQFIFVTFSSDKGVYDDEIVRLGGIIFHIRSPYYFFDFLKLKKCYPNARIAHLHTYFNCGICALWFRILGLDKIISHSHTTLPKSKARINSYYESISRWLINKLSTQKIACSKLAAVSLFGFGQDYIYLPNFVDPALFIKGTQNNKSHIIQVGHVGRFSPEKNHAFILELAKFAKLNKHPICFNLVGAGPLLKSTQQEVVRYNLQDFVKFIEPSNQIHQLMNQFDCFVLPSTIEGFGLVLLEAQASSLPCFVSHSIQSEAILDLNLVKSLDYNVEDWITNILSSKKNKLESSDIINSFKRAGLDYDSIIRKLEFIYEQ
ncbi:glycosyltransferase [Endozoicomonas acroporae]|uniref:glycosyltransferase n=1 Tax=Endozoicomonas acroporae TaxID=1701104 RepID=UPI003D7B6F7A